VGEVEEEEGETGTRVGGERHSLRKEEEATSTARYSQT